MEFVAGLWIQLSHILRYLECSRKDPAYAMLWTGHSAKTLGNKQSTHIITLANYHIN